MFLGFFPASSSSSRGYPQPSRAAQRQWQSVAVGASGSRLPVGAVLGGYLKNFTLPKPKPIEARAHSWAPWGKKQERRSFPAPKEKRKQSVAPSKGRKEMKPKSRLRNVSRNQTSFLSDFSSWEGLSLVSQPHLLQPGTLTTLFMLYLLTDVWLTSPGHCQEARHERDRHISGLAGMALGSP